MAEAITTTKEREPFTGPPSPEGLPDSPIPQPVRPAGSKSRLRLKAKQPSVSTGSGSGTQKRKISLPRGRVLKRGCHYRPFSDSDVKWLWAAYRMDGLANFPEGMDQASFIEFVVQATAVQQNQGGQVLMLDAQIFEKQQRFGPVGLASIRYDGNEARPFVDWFPWASRRNKIECGVKLLNDLNKQKLVLFHTGESVLIGHLARYGLLRPVGWVKVKNGGDRRMYQGV